MTRKKLLKDIQERLKDDIIDFYDKSPKRIYIEIKPGSLVKVAAYIFKDLGARFNIAPGVDTQANIEILYHFSGVYPLRRDYKEWDKKAIRDRGV